MLVSGVSAPVAVGFGDGVDGGAFFAGGMRGVRGVREAGPRLAGVVVELHQAEDQVRGHKFKCEWGIGDDIPAEKKNTSESPGSERR